MSFRKMINIKLIYTILIIIGLIFFGCGGKEEVKPSVDSVMTQNALRTIDIIKEAYQKKDKEAIQANALPTVSETILKGLFFEEAKLSLAPRLVRITSSNIIVHLNWIGEWIIKDKILKDRGVAMLVFKRETMKLIRIDGDNPFHTP